jgi:hypothetical protein
MNANSNSNSSKSKESLKSSSKKTALAEAAAAAGAVVEHLEPAEGEFKEIDFPYNQRTKQSYEKAGLPVPYTVDYQERMFLSIVNTEPDKGGPIERVITRIVRSRERDYATGNKISFKEWIVFYENWYGKNWLGEEIPPVSDHCEGMYMEQDVKERRDRDMTTGRLLPLEKKRIGEYPVFYIPFTEKKVREIVGDRDNSSIVFTVKFPRESVGTAGNNVRNNFSFEQFLKPLDELYKINASVGGPIFPQKSANSLTFQPG